MRGGDQPVVGEQRGAAHVLVAGLLRELDGSAGEDEGVLKVDHLYRKMKDRLTTDLNTQRKTNRQTNRQNDN